MKKWEFRIKQYEYSLDKKAILDKITYYFKINN